MAKKCGECRGTGMDTSERDRNAVACPDCAGTESAMRTFSVEVVRYYSVTLRAKNSRDAIRRTNAGEGDLDDSDAGYAATGKVRRIKD
ncbi:MAG: hypothetical protein ACYCPQ_00495 [Elusimicrobiota bacterium]